MIFLYIILYLLAVNAFTYGLYAWDKRQASLQSWRIPETSLLVAGLIGGTPAAFFAQHRLRHKTSKTSFQVKYWLTVVAQLVLIVIETQKFLAVM